MKTICVLMCPWHAYQPVGSSEDAQSVISGGSFSFQEHSKTQFVHRFSSCMF